MKINVSGQKLKLTKGLVKAATNKCKKAVAHYAAMVDHVDVVLTEKDNAFSAEARTTYKGHTVVAHAESADMYQSIGEMANKLHTQLAKQKELAAEAKKQKPATPSMTM